MTYKLEDLICSLNGIEGFAEESFRTVHESGEQVTSIRYNPAKIDKIKIPGGLEKVPWSSYGYYLKERPSFTLDPAFHAGAYYVQEASSMFLQEVMKQSLDLQQDLKILDLCAAPGGKSTLIQSVISSGSLLVSNEIIKSRVSILAENITKWGSANVVVTNNEPSDFQRLETFFDVVVVDAPCSGSGLFRKDPNAITEWSPENIFMCSERQQKILQDILPALKPGGMLIYSTCSYSFEENEFIVDWLLNEGLTSIQIEIKQYPGIIETISKNNTGFGYRFFPDKIKGEGFFISAFRKNSTGLRESRPAKNKFQLITKKEEQIIKPFVESVFNHTYIKWNEEIIALPHAIVNDILRIQSVLYIRKAGVKVGSIKQDSLIPSHDLALSDLLNPDFPNYKVDLETALDYLRRRDIKLITDKKSWLIIQYDHLPLGWVKNLGARINNYYPKEWRILNK